MSLTTIPSASRMSRTGFSQPSHAATTTLRSSHSGSELPPFVDLQDSPYPQADGSLGSMPAHNPVPDLIPDEFYEILRAHDLISEKGIRDHIIRKAFKAMREQQELKSCEALARLQAIYPYLQIDTIRKIIYRIGPGANRKAMMF
jgi:hypothetical protein